VRVYFKNGTPYYKVNGGSETELGSGTGGSSGQTYNVEWNETGEVADGDAGIAVATRLADQETLSVDLASLGVVGSGAPPSGVNLTIISLDSSWNGTQETVIISGDGTNKTDVTGSPITSYQNTTGSQQDVAIVVDNGQFGAPGTGSTEEVVTTGDGDVA